MRIAAEGKNNNSSCSCFIAGDLQERSLSIMICYRYCISSVIVVICSRNHFSVGLIYCSAACSHRQGNDCPVSAGGEREREMVVVSEHFCLDVSLLSGKKSPMKNDKSKYTRAGGR